MGFEWRIASRVSSVIMLLLISFILLTAGCRNNKNHTPEISGFTPTSGETGDVLTITGKYFSTDASKNIVNINGTAAVVTSSTSTQIVTTVPEEASTGRITVTRNGLTGTSATDFTVVSTPVTLAPAITGFSPDNGQVGTTVIITGTDFSTTPTENAVKFNNTSAAVTASTATRITTTVPEGASTGKITVTVGESSAISSADFTVILPDVEVASITVTPAAPAINVGGTQQFTATATMTDTTTQDVTYDVDWSSSNTGIATIDDAGIASGLADGTSTISAEMDGITGAAALTVNGVAPTVASITVTPAAPAIDVGGTQQFTATANMTDTTTQDVTDDVDWSSSDTDIATIDDAGLASGLADGTSTISAEMDGITGTATLTVNEVETGVNGLVYIWPFNQDDLYVYNILNDGQLEELATSPVVNGGALGGFRVVTDNTGSYVYTQYTPGFHASRVDRTSGSLTPLDGSPFTIAGTPDGLWAHPAQPWMYGVSYQGSINIIRVYDISGEAFTTSDSGTNVGYNYPVAQAFTPDNAFFYIVGQDSNTIPYTFSLLSFEVDATTGQLTEILPRNTDVKNGLVVSADGKYLYAGNYWLADTDPGAINRYAINAATGELTLSGSTTFDGQPLVMVLDPSAPLLYVAAKNTDYDIMLFVFEIDSDTGDLTQLGVTALDPLLNAYRMDMKAAPDGGIVYVSSDSGGSGVYVKVYSIDDITGDAQELQGLTVSTSGLQPTILVIPPAPL